MKYSVVVLLFLWCSCSASAQASNELTADIVRAFSKDIFDLNSIPFMQPMVVSINATSNARFFHSAFVPAKNDTFYIRFGFQGMFGFVREDQRTYTPHMPTDSTGNAVVQPLAVLINNKIKDILKRGIQQDSIHVPASAATILGHLESFLPINKSYVLRELKKDPLYQLAVKAGLDSTVIDNSINNLPDQFPLPIGANLKTVAAVVPQVEIGSLYGTELLIRYIPPIKLDTNVGKFTFWGVGIKHSLSQYFPSSWRNPDPWCDLAVQVVYQGTTLKNTVGATNAELKATATIWDANIEASKKLGIFNAYTGFSVETISTDASYTYTLPRNLQKQLGLITWKDANGNGLQEDDEFVPDPANGYPGDTKPQVSSVALKDTNYKWIIGGAVQLGHLVVSLDYSISKFNIFSGGLELQF